MERCVSACKHPSSRHYFINIWTRGEYKKKVRDIFGLILNKIQTGLEDVSTCQNQLIKELTSHRLTSFQNSRRPEKISRNRASSHFLNKLSWK